METVVRSLLPLIFILPILIAGFTFSKSIVYRKKQFRRLSEFYLSLVLFSLCSWLLLPLGGAYVILSMLSWIWVLRTLGEVTEDISGQHLFSKFHFYALSLGGIISIVFLAFDFRLTTISAPFSLSIGLIGLTFIFQAYAKGKAREYSYLHHINLFIILAFFITRLVFPLLLADEAWVYRISVIDTYFTVIFCASLYPLYAEIIFEGQEKMLEKVLQTRNKQLLSHSGFSEYKILSAGLSHEINNALTVINAKIVRLLRSNPDLQTDLQIIQRASNRIVNGIRGLREFIYPHESYEVLDIQETVQSVLDLYGQRLMNHGVQVNLNNLSGKLVKGQRVQIAQIFLSLINNSVDALDKLEEKWINISAKTVEDFVEIFYEDASRSKADKIFPILDNPFYSFHEFMDNDIRLILIKDIIEKHGGAFRCKHQVNSAFQISLPEAEASQSTDMNIQTKIQEVRELH